MATNEPPRTGRRRRRAPLRRLKVATAIFALAAVTIVALVGAFIVQDLSQSYVSGVLTQAQGEAEAFARMVSEPQFAGEGETVDSVSGGAGRPLDADAVLPDRLGGTVAQAPAPGQTLAQEGSPEVPAPRAARVGGRVPAVMASEGQEMRYFVNGALVGRDAVQDITIQYPGGRKRLLVRTIDEKQFDRRALQDPGTLIQKVRVQHPPSSRRVMLSWQSKVAGEQVQLQAGVDADVLDEGVADLRSRIVPKVIAGAGLFLLLLAVAYTYVFRLFSEAQRLEAEANQQALLAEVGMLAAGLAHEIRNPLSAVHMNLQLLEEDLAEREKPEPQPPGPSEGAGEHLTLLRAAQREIRRLGALVSDFLAYARPGDPRRAPQAVDSLVSDCVQLFQPVACGQGVALSAHLGAGEEQVMLDDAMIKQALMNVMLNAIQAVPKPGGHVVVRTRVAGSEVQVAVEDDGPGLPDDVDSLFRVFHSTKKGGSGLGLAISKAIVERHGGRLDARTLAGGGAVFTIAIPAEAAA